MAKKIKLPADLPEEMTGAPIEGDTITVKHEFSKTEISDMQDEVLAALAEEQSLNAELKSVKQDFASKISTVVGRRDRLANLCRQGYEDRQIKCSMVRDFQKRERVYFDPETREILDRQPFRPSDNQLKFDLERKEGLEEVQQEAKEDEGFDERNIMITAIREEFPEKQDDPRTEKLMKIIKGHIPSGELETAKLSVLRLVLKEIREAA